MGKLIKGLHWGRIRGVIRITGAAALEDFSFSTKPSAEGLLFRVYKYVTSGGKEKTDVFVNNYVPPTDAHSPSQLVQRSRFRVLANIAYSNYDILKWIWRTLARRRQVRCPKWDTHFIGTNLSLVGTPPNWLYMKVTDGYLEPTSRITAIALGPANIQVTLTFDSSIYQNGNSNNIAWGCIYSKSTNVLEFPLPTKVWYRSDGQWKGNMTTPRPVNDLIGFVFFNDACANYSPSASIEG